MILYYGVTTYQFFCFMVHKLSEKRNDKAILLLPERINNADLLKENFIKTGIFEDIIKYKEFFPKSKIINEEVIENAIKDSIAIVKEYNIDFKSFSDLYIASDHYSLGVFLNINKIKYNFFEEGNGRLSSSEEVFEHLEKINPIRAKIARRLKLFGFSENVEHRYGNLSYKKDETYFDRRDIDFNVSKRLSTLSSKDIETIFRAFGVSKEQISAILNSNFQKQILLTQHYINMGLLTYEGQISLYRNLIDYFGDNNSNLIIKPHPSDIHVDYQEILPGSVVLPRIFPAELLTVLNLNFTRGIAASSTSINSLSDIVDKIVCFDQKIEKDIYNFDKYYICSQLLNILKIKSIKLLGVNELLLREFTHITTDKEGDKIWVIDKPKTNAFRVIQDTIANAANDNAILIFLDTERNSYFINNHNILANYNIFPIAFDRIEGKTFISRDFIYIYSKNPSIFLEIIEKMKVEKKLKYSGITIKVDCENEIETKIYQGINIALENRLADVTNAYKRLLKSKEINISHQSTLALKEKENNKVNLYNNKKNQIRTLEKLIVRIFTLGNDKKYKKYLRNREQYFKDGWFYRKFKNQ